MKIGKQFADEKQVLKSKRQDCVVEATIIHDGLTDKQKLKIVKKGLPITTKMFHKISVFGSGVTASGDIFIMFWFGNKQDSFIRKCNVLEIKNIVNK